MKRIEEIEHKFPALPNVVQEMKINKIETQEYKEEKQEYKELLVIERDEEKAEKEKHGAVLDSLCLKLINLGINEEEIAFLGIQSPKLRVKEKSNNSDNSKKKLNQ